MTRLRFAFAALVVGLATLAWAAGPTFLGNVFRLGSSTTAGLPTSSSTIAGGLIYLSDDAGILWNNGSSWQSLTSGSGSGSGSSFWYDAGAGYIYAQETLKNPDGGAVYIRASQPPDHSNMTDGLVLGHTTSPEGVNLSPMFSFVGTPSSPPQSSRMGSLFASQSTSGSVRAGLVLWGGGEITFQKGGIGDTPGRAATLLGYWGTSGLTMNEAGGAGTPVQFRVEDPGTTDNGNIRFFSDATGISPPMLQLNGNGGNTQVSINSASSSGSALYVQTGNAPTAIQVVNNGGVGGIIATNAPSGTAAFKADITGAVWKIGAGTVDQIVSDGTGLETPSYWESTRAFSSGSGVFAAAATLSGAGGSSFTSANNTTLGTGAISRNTSLDTIVHIGASGGARPIVEPVWDRQTISTRVVGNGLASYAEIAEYVACNAYGGTAAKVQAYVSGGAATTTTVASSGRTYFGIASIADGAQKYWTTACSSAATTPYAFLTPNSGASQMLNYCQRILMHSDVSSQRVWVTLSESLPSADSDNLASGVGFRYSAGVSANWYYCGFTGGSSSCTDTGIAATASTEFTLCTDMVLGAGAAFYINGNYIGLKTMDALTNAYPLVMLDPTGAVTRAVYMGPMNIETR